MAVKIERIIEAFTKESNILDRQLSGYHCKQGMFGDDVINYTGGYCVTVPMKKGNESDFSKCLRIWWRNPSQIKERSNLVAKALRNSQMTYFVDYEYLDNALMVDGIAVPGIRMDWLAKTVTLSKFLSKNNPTSLQIEKIARNFYRMCADLNKAGFSHGDLSSSNILVNPDMSLKLIDYDSMYVPIMGNRFKQDIGGTDGYQHPQRTANIAAGNRNDYFSQQVIYVQLLALAIRPQLCRQVSDKEILFTKNDLETPQSFRSSTRYKLLSSLGDPTVQLYLNELERAIGQPIEKVCSVCEIVVSENKSHYNFRFCPMCGREYFAEDRYCAHCGCPREI